MLSSLRLPSKEQVLNLDPVHNASLCDGRTAGERTAVKGVLFQARLAPGEMVRWYVRHLDLSANWPLTSGRTVSLRVGGLPAPVAPVEMVVRACQPFGSHWIVECEFLVRPEDEVLHALTAPVAQ